MGMTLSKVKGKVATTEVAWDGETVEIGYKPNEITPALLETVQEAAAEGKIKVVADLLEPVLDWWDVLDDDGARLPTDAATIQQMPLAFLMEVLNATQEQMRPPGSKG